MILELGANSSPLVRAIAALVLGLHVTPQGAQGSSPERPHCCPARAQGCIDEPETGFSSRC
jgi:hypothetical protein